ncbi:MULTISPECIES: regulatory protein RecX [unclassified Agrococcus]|uniref:regulatory protein RecX n=1 Tax=unclassified Agrococcus TaxID=2615065 RepID=UPI00361704CE
MRVVDLAEVRAAKELASAEALDVARRALGRRALSRAEVARRLDEHGVEAQDRDAALDRLEEEGAIDDRALAESVAERVRSRRKAGARVVEQELARRGIADEHRTPAPSDDDELERAVGLAEQRLRRAPIDEGAERRVAGMLARRGFASGICRRAIEAAKARLDGSDEG